MFREKSGQDDDYYVDLYTESEVEMRFDKRVGKERSQFATQTPMMNGELLETIKAGFVGDESLEFYEGLLAGYACSYQIFCTMLPDSHAPTIGGLIAYISEILEERF